MSLRHHVFLHLTELPVLYKVKCMIGNNKKKASTSSTFSFKKGIRFAGKSVELTSLHQCKLSGQENLFSVSISTELKLNKFIMFMMKPKSSPI